MRASSISGYVELSLRHGRAETRSYTAFGGTRYAVAAVSAEKATGRSKQQRREQRHRAARRGRLLTQLRRAAIVASLLAIPGLWAFDRSGPQVTVDAEVIETRRWRHTAQDGTSHPHLSATLKIEGLSEATLDRADGYQRGQRVPVWIRRGRISGWPYFLDIVKPGEAERR